MLRICATLGEEERKGRRAEGVRVGGGGGGGAWGGCRVVVG